MVQRRVLVRGATNQALDELDAADIPALPYDAAGAAAAAQASSQPVDSDLTAIAALTTTAYGRALLALADAAALRTAGELGTASTIPIPFPPYRTGGTFFYAPLHGVETALALVQDTLYAMPFFVPVTTTFDAIGVVASGTTGSAACRLGIFSDTAGVPDALVVDAGQVSTATAGFKSIAISQALTAGWYWLACAMQGAAGLLFSAPSASGVTFVPSAAPGTALISGYARTGVSSTLPSPWGATKTATARCPIVWVAPH